MADGSDVETQQNPTASSTTAATAASNKESTAGGLTYPGHYMNDFIERAREAKDVGALYQEHENWKSPCISVQKFFKKPLLPTKTHIETPKRLFLWHNIIILSYLEPILSLKNGFLKNFGQKWMAISSSPCS